MSNEPIQRPLGVAMIGYAFMGKAHSNAWRNVASYFDVPALEQKVLVGRDAAAVSEAAAKYGWQETATDWRSVLDRDDIHIVDICAPGWMHAEIAIAALEAGKHVLLEKPLANTLAEAEAITAAARAARAKGVQSMVGFNYRRVPALALAKELVSEGRLGAIRQVRAAYLQDWLADEAAPMTWRLKKETAGSGALGDIASHAIDQVLFLLGDQVTEVSGRLQTFVNQRPGAAGLEDVTVDDAAWATLTLASGAIASVEASRVATGRKNSLQIEIYGDKGALRFDLENLNELQFLDATAPAREQGFRRIVVTEPEHPYLDAWWPQGHIIGWEHTFTHEIRDLLLAIDGGTEPSPSFEDGLEVQRILAAVEESAAAKSALIQLSTYLKEPDMPRPYTLFTGQWADLPFEEVARLASGWGYDGLEIAVSGDHLDAWRWDEPGYVESKLAILNKYNLKVWAISNHLKGQAVCDDPIDFRHEAIVGAKVWGDGDPEGVRQRAAEEMKHTARLAKALGVDTVVGFTGSSIWQYVAMFPPVPEKVIDAGYQDFADRWNPILDVFDECGVRFAHEVHPSEIAYDYWTTVRTLEAIGHRPAFGLNWDPSHMMWQGIDPVSFIWDFKDRIYHVDCKDTKVRQTGRNTVMGSHLAWGDPRRGWDFVSAGRGDVPWEASFRALTAIGYDGPISVEWEDAGMDRLHGAPEALAALKKFDFPPSNTSFDAAFKQ
jgi:predicted dehydrogenase/sugar phosphate isomerase/epimerase